MSANDDIPDDILEAVKVLAALREKNFLSREEKDTINRAKLRIAYWACRNESVVASRENLAYVLGSDANEIMAAYDKFLDRTTREEAARTKRRQDLARRPRGTPGGNFWGG